jgi:hypothetical protein
LVLNDLPETGTPTPGVVYTITVVSAIQNALWLFGDPYGDPPGEQSMGTIVNFDQVRFTFDSEGNEHNVDYSYVVAWQDRDVTIAQDLSSASATATLTLETCNLAGTCTDKDVFVSATWTATGVRQVSVDADTYKLPGSMQVISGQRSVRPATGTATLDGSVLPGRIIFAGIESGHRLALCVDRTGELCGS